MSINRNVRHPLISGTVPRYAASSACVIFGNSAISAIFNRCCQSEIFNPIIQSIPINVINLIAIKIGSIDDCPDDSMGSDWPLSEFNKPIRLAWFHFCGTPSHPPGNRISAQLHLPPQPARAGRVHYEEFAEPLNRRQRFRLAAVLPVVCLCCHIKKRATRGRPGFLRHEWQVVLRCASVVVDALALWLP